MVHASHPNLGLGVNAPKSTGDMAELSAYIDQAAPAAYAARRAMERAELQKLQRHSCPALSTLPGARKLLAREIDLGATVLAEAGQDSKVRRQV